MTLNVLSREKSGRPVPKIFRKVMVQKKLIIMKNKIKNIIIIFLLVTNIATITTIVMHHQKMKKHFQDFNHKPPHDMPPEKHFDEFLIKELEFNKKQAQNFKVIRIQFIQNADKIHDSMIIFRETIDIELKNENPDSIKLFNAAKKIGHFHTELKLLSFQYILETKEICTKKQQKKLFEIFGKMHHKQRKKCNNPKQ